MTPNRYTFDIVVLTGIYCRQFSPESLMIRMIMLLAKSVGFLFMDVLTAERVGARHHESN